MLYYEYKMKRWEVVKMEFLETKKVIEEMMQKDYKTFVTALISIEKDITNQEVLDIMYQKYMNTDEMYLLNDEFDEMIEYHLWKNYDLILNFCVIMTIYHNFWEFNVEYWKIFVNSINLWINPD